MLSRRVIPLIAVLAAGGCPRAPAADRRPPDKTDKREKTVPAAATHDEAGIRKLFDDAAACGDRYRCPPLDELARRAEDLDDRLVLKVAFDLMNDPAVQSHSRL